MACIHLLLAACFFLNQSRGVSASVLIRSHGHSVSCNGNIFSMLQKAAVISEIVDDPGILLTPLRRLLHALLHRDYLDISRVFLSRQGQLHEISNPGAYWPVTL